VSDEADQGREHIAHTGWSPDNAGASTEATIPVRPWAAPPARNEPPKNELASNELASNELPMNARPMNEPPRPSYETGDAVYWPSVPLPPWPPDEDYPSRQDGPPVARPPAARRSGRVIGLVIGLVIALATGAAGYLVGGRTGTHPPPQPQPSPSPSLQVYESSQARLNRAKLDDGFAPLAQPLLPSMGGCTADTDAGGMKLPTDESRHVFCRYGGTTVHFSLYKSHATLDAERAYRQQLLTSTEDLLPGAAQSGQRKGGRSGQSGNYVEYAWKAEDGRAWCGVWWDRDDVPLAGLRLEALCQEGLGGSWAPLRDLWQRYS
jgi:hypothetical protein